MQRSMVVLAAALAALPLVRPVPAQKFQPKTIQFKGDPEYSDKEMMDAAGLKKGTVLDYAQMNEHSKRLLDTGLFATLAFKFDGQDLIFMLTPSTDLYPIRVENLPLVPGKDLDTKLHDQLSLYHGKVPADGGLAEDVRAVLEKMLASEGIAATVVAATAADPATHKVNSVVYSITAPPVLVGEVHLDGVSAQYLTTVQRIEKDAAKVPFDTENATANLARPIEQFYQDQGYAAVKVEVSQSGVPMSSSSSIQIPFSLKITEGRTYTVDSIHLPAGVPMTQADVDKTLAPRPGGPVQGVRVRSVWEHLAASYKAKGNLDCKITPHAEFNDAAGTVSYTVDVDPGPVYHLGFVKFDNVSDALRTMLIRYWQMMPGDVFDESYVASFIIKVQDQDPVLKRSLAGVKTTFDATADPQTHDVNVVIHLAK
jgi:outer membrane protein assembly factor BamA